MAHNIRAKADSSYYCSFCGKESNFDMPCAVVVEQENIKIEAAAALQRKMLFTFSLALLVIATLFTAMSTYFLHVAVDWGNNNVNKVTKTMEGGLDKGNNGLKLLAKAVFGGFLALLGKATFLGDALQRMVSSLFHLGA